MGGGKKGRKGGVIGVVWVGGKEEGVGGREVCLFPRDGQMGQLL